MKLLVDVNLSPRWVDVLRAAGFESAHWTALGDPRAPDLELMRFARANGYVVFTHDLDFGALLALTRSQGPSVLQIRTRDVLPDATAELVMRALAEFGEALEAGALVTVDQRASRVRILPIR